MLSALVESGALEEDAMAVESRETPDMRIRLGLYSRERRSIVLLVEECRSGVVDVENG